jgi:hypothetical protein
MVDDRDPDEPITVTLRRGQWMVLISAASSYNYRVPLDQGDGGACLDTIREAIDPRRKDASS